MAIPAIARANLIKGLINSGYSQEEARRIVDSRATRGTHGETVVPTADGTGIRPAGPQGRLFAAVDAAPVLQYDQRAIAAMWDGMVDALRTGGTVDAAALFPDGCSVPQHDARFANERAMGAEMAKLLPVAIKALGVTVPEWSAWYARSAAVVLRPHPAGCGCGCGMGAPQLPGSQEPKAAVSNWGSPFGAPLLEGR